MFDGQSKVAGALAGAEALGNLLDSLHTEEIDPARFAPQVVPDSHAVHWQQGLEFLQIITSFWPDAFNRAQVSVTPHSGASRKCRRS